MTDPQTPSTEAGRRLMAYDGPDVPVTLEEILAIEAEARADALEDVGRTSAGSWDQAYSDGRADALREAADTPCPWCGGRPTEFPRLDPQP